MTSLLLQDRTALVTGADRGIGRVIALALARAGARVAINCQADTTQAELVADEVRAAGAEALVVQADVRIATEVEAMMRHTADRFGRLDLLVNNAGVQTWTPLLEVTEDEWDLVIDTNLKGCFLCTQAAARTMVDTGGAIVNLGSGSNKVPFPTLVAYTASKGGIEMLTKVSALELAPYRIRVNCVAPGAVEIERTRLERPNYGEVMGRATPLGRVGTPEDIADAVIFLAGPAARFITGQTLYVDGGLFIQPPRVDER